MGVLKSIEHVPTGENDSPTLDVVIADCGEIKESEDDGIRNFFKDGYVFPNCPADIDNGPVELSWWLDAVDSIRACGNEAFKLVWLLSCEYFGLDIGCKVLSGYDLNKQWTSEMFEWIQRPSSPELCSSLLKSVFWHDQLYVALLRDIIRHYADT
ncbi:hypothetical protein LXL04_033744 [Taraxacum kok-saghyz]